jgi:hypothetical protein
MRDEYEDPQYGFTSDGTTILFDGEYGRLGGIRVTDTVCGGCGKAAMCLHVDQSEGEYKPGIVCRDCIVRLFGAECSERELSEVLGYAAPAKNPKPAPTRQGGAPATAPAVGLPGAAGEGPGKVTITCNEAGDCVAVTRTDDEGRILSVLWERGSVHSGYTQP